MGVGKVPAYIVEFTIFFILLGGVLLCLGHEMETLAMVGGPGEVIGVDWIAYGFGLSIGVFKASGSRGLGVRGQVVSSVWP